MKETGGSNDKRRIQPGDFVHSGIENQFPEGRVDMEELTGLVDSGFVKVTHHPQEPISVYNYNSAVRDKGEQTPLRDMCRGLIVDNEGVIVARPFSKIRDLNSDEELPAGEFTAYEKLDGTLGIQYRLEDEPTLATRGEFSDTRGRTRLRNATERLREIDYPFDPEVTYLWEIIDGDYPQVVDYGDRQENVLLGMIETASGRDIPLPYQQDVPFTVVPRFDDIQTTAELRAKVERPNTEGFVMLNDVTGERTRIKSEGYLWKDAARKGIAVRRVLERLSSGEGYDAFLATLPDEVQEEIGAIATRIQQEYQRVRKRSKGNTRGYEAIKRGRQAGEDVSPLIWKETWNRLRKS